MRKEQKPQKPSQTDLSSGHMLLLPLCMRLKLEQLADSGDCLNIYVNRTASRNRRSKWNCIKEIHEVVSWTHMNPNWGSSYHSISSSSMMMMMMMMMIICGILEYGWSSVLTQNCSTLQFLLLLGLAGIHWGLSHPLQFILSGPLSSMTGSQIKMIYSDWHHWNTLKRWCRWWAHIPIEFYNRMKWLSWL